MAIAIRPEAETLSEKIAKLHILDTDIHNDLPSLEELRPYLASKWHPWLDDGGREFASRGVAHVGSGRMDDVVNAADNLCAGDPEWTIEQLIKKYNIDRGVLTGTMAGLNMQRDQRFMDAVAVAYNEWVLNKWIYPYPYFKGSIHINSANAEAAAKEIHRVGDNPGFVQVMMASHGRDAHGHRNYWPIYQAAVEHGLPIGVHVSADVGNSYPQTSVGWYSTFLEHHTDHSQNFMANAISLITEGVFEEFPTLQFAMIEGGIAWMPFVMGRLDRLYPALKAEVPYLKKLPSEYLLEHCYISTQPIEEPEKPSQLLEILDLVDAEHRVIFASDYPHWDFDNPITALDPLPPALRRRIMVDNVVDLYGPRLLAPSRRTDGHASNDDAGCVPRRDPPARH